jgi:hypothetical protein
MIAPRAICMWCSEPAIRYCDAPIGFIARGCHRDKNGAITLLAGSDETGDYGMHTCDAPMCAKHVKQIGHISGKNPESIDRCPYHVAHGDPDLKDAVCFPDEVEPMRRKIYAEIRRAQLGVA